MKKILFLLPCLILLAVLCSSGAAAGEVSATFGASLVDPVTLEEDVFVQVATGDEVLLRLHLSAASLPSYSLQIQYDKSAFTLVGANLLPIDTDSGERVRCTLRDGAITENFMHLAMDVADTLSGEHQLGTLRFMTTGEPSESPYAFRLAAGDGQTVQDLAFDTVHVRISHVHAFGDWVVATAPTDTADGSETRTCLHCQKKELRVLPMTVYRLALAAGAEQIRHDEEKKLFYALKPGTTAAQLLAKIEADVPPVLLDAAGNTVDADTPVKTGMKLVLRDTAGNVRASATTSVLGDATGDGGSSGEDARMTLRQAVGLTQSPDAVLAAMDSNLDGRVRADDARTILRVAVQLDAFYNVPATDIRLNRSSLTLYTGQGETLTATLVPTDTTLRGITWRSSNPAVASVTQGRITAHKGGKAVITATANSGVSASCSLTVLQAAQTVALSRDSYYLYEGRSLQLSYTFTPADSVTTGAVWTSSNPDFQVVNGVVTCTKAFAALSDRSTVITLQMPGGKTTSATVRMVSSADSLCTIKNASGTVAVGQQFQIEHMLYGKTMASWVFSNNNLVSVNDGVLTAEKVGVVEIRCGNTTHSDVFTLTIAGSLSAAEKQCRATLRIDSCRIYDRSAQGTVSVAIKFANTSQKTIAGIAFHVLPYDAAGNPCTSADGSTEKVCTINKTLPPNGTGDAYLYGWASLWTNSSIVTPRMTKVEIHYTDGSSVTLTGEQVTHIFW